MSYIDITLDRCALEVWNNSVNRSLNWGSGRSGLWVRYYGLVYNYETFLRAPIEFEGLFGATIHNVSLEITSYQQGDQFLSTNAFLFQQDKTPFGYYNDPPRYDDFPSHPWDVTLDTITVKNTGTYTFSSTPLKNLIIKWANQSVNYLNGLIVAMDFRALNWWLTINNAVLKIEYDGTIQEDKNKHMLNPKGLGNKLLNS